MSSFLKTLCLGAFLISPTFSQLVSAQEIESHNVLRVIESDLENGRISLNEAIVEPFRLVFNAEASIYKNSVSNFQNLKCLNSSVGRYKNEKARLDEGVVNEVEGYFRALEQNVSQMQAFIISESGKFRINYDTTGSNAVSVDDLDGNGISDYVERTAEAADSSYRHQVLTLGFRDPIPPATLYNIYFQNIGFYGFTQRSVTEPSGTYIVVHNNFNGFPPNTDPEGNEIGALKVTVAHEFKHAIQFSQNGWNGDSDAWAEMDATLMEEVVYDNVNDYYNYIEGSGSLIRSPQQTLIPGSYEDITFALYFHEKFGDFFWTDTWERIEVSPLSISLLTAVESELESENETYRKEVTENYLWHLASGPNNSSINYGFKDREFYPNPNLTATFFGLTDSLSTQRSLNRMAANYYMVDLQTEAEGNVAVLLSAESEEINAGVIAYFNNGSSEALISNDNSLGSRRISAPWEWSEVSRLGIAVVNTSRTASSTFRIGISSDIPQKLELAQNYPNPFNPSTTIPIEIPETQFVSLKVYDITGRLVQTLLEGEVQTGFYEINFDGSALASGVYLYQLRTEKGAQFQKMLLVK